ncbi:Ros/MucR family transcriptional regulator [Govanella unica]|uniref:MucR family transcriptional regulator n=1 Tax=Govanella unica TaxID=2975056 RepID=A0A9X3TZK1_9PROT|nr:MucR family transcriptional regulator [Govania unica]MDA5194683.1 MucR family transcriptional regulator [Govania unica]
MEEKLMNQDELLALTTEIVSSYVANNSVPVSELGVLIGQVYATLDNLGAVHVVEEPQLQPAVPIKKSILPDYLVCLEDGRKLKMLKRHLKTSYNMTPEDYRERWGLPADYPMVAPNYAIQRRELAKKIGLGRGRPRRK